MIWSSQMPHKVVIKVNEALIKTNLPEPLIGTSNNYQKKVEANDALL